MEYIKKNTLPYFLPFSIYVLCHLLLTYTFTYYTLLDERYITRNLWGQLYILYTGRFVMKMNPCLSGLTSDANLYIHIYNVPLFYLSLSLALIYRPKYLNITVANTRPEIQVYSLLILFFFI